MNRNKLEEHINQLKYVISTFRVDENDLQGLAALNYYKQELQDYEKRLAEYQYGPENRSEESLGARVAAMSRPTPVRRNPTLYNHPATRYLTATRPSAPPVPSDGTAPFGSLSFEPRRSRSVKRETYIDFHDLWNYADTICSICQCADYGNYYEEDQMIITSCGHVFHRNCFMVLLKHTLMCPICRAIFEWFVENIVHENFYTLTDIKLD